MTVPVSGVGATGAAYPTAAAGNTSTPNPMASGGSMLDPQAFLQLLVAQLKYQDPTNPTDTSTFMNQTAMLSQVQTMGSMSTTLSTLAQSQQVQSATSMIGKQATYIDATGARATGIVTSASLSAGVATLKIGDSSVPLSGVIEVALPATS